MKKLSDKQSKLLFIAIIAIIAILVVGIIYQFICIKTLEAQLRDAQNASNFQIVQKGIYDAKNIIF